MAFILYPQTMVSVCKVSDRNRRWKPHITRKELRFEQEHDYQRVQVSCPRFTSGVTVENGIIVDAAPIVEKFVGQPLCNLVNWAGKDTEVTVLEKTKGSSGAVVFREGEWLILTRREFVGTA